MGASNYCANVMLRFKEEFKYKNRTKFVVIVICLIILLFTGAAFDIDKDLIKDVENHISTEDFKNEMESMKDGSVANEITTGIQSYSSLDYEFEIYTGDKNDDFVEEITTLLEKGLLDFMKG